jgi:ribose 5-phosphate isomerase B
VKKETIAVGSDHGGFELKGIIKKFLEEKEYLIKDFGCDSEESCDYPDYGLKVAECVAKEEVKGILICGTGIGMSIVANKIPNIRAALCYDEYTAEMSRAHNDANILVLGGRVLKGDLALKIVDIWLKTKFEGNRHLKRINKIKEVEKRYMKS